MAIRLHRFGEVVSTQDAVHQLAAAGAPAGTTVVAAVQTAGRGSRGRRWCSPRGGLWLSVLLRPGQTTAREAAMISPSATAQGAGTLPPMAIGVEVLSVRVGLAVAAVLDALPGVPPVQLKWPNDLMLAGRKLGGVLSEARWQGATLGWITVGLGLNVANTLPDDVSPPPARLADFGLEMTPEELADPVARAIAGVPVDEEHLGVSELAAFAARDWLRGRRLAEPVAGQGAGLAADGALLVRTADGRHGRVRSGSVVVAAAG